MKFSDIFAWQIDFLNEPQKGDKYKLIYEEYEKDGKFISYGEILAAEYEASGTKYDAILYQDPAGQAGLLRPCREIFKKSFPEIAFELQENHLRILGSPGFIRYLKPTGPITG